MGYVAPIEEAGLSSKEKALKRSRGRNFDPIVTKLGTNVGVSYRLSLEIGYVEPIGEAGPSSKDFFPSLQAKMLIKFSPNLVKWLK